MSADAFLRYWAKTDRSDEAAYHPVAYHCLDVAAAGRTLLERDHLRRQRLAMALGLPEEAVVAWVTFLLALHDLGKLSDGFQAIRRDLMRRLQGRDTHAVHELRHDSLGYLLLRDLVAGRLGGDVGFAFSHVVVEPWLRAAMGHHGEPPRRAQVRLTAQFPPPVLADALAFVQAAAQLLLPAGFPFPEEPDGDREDAATRSSWLFAGLATAADWIGSNSGWFPFRREPLELADYFESVALPQAAAAVAASGLLPARPSAAAGLSVFLPDATPTPLQDLAQRISVAAGPQLFVIEEVTGGGKTEAALALAHRLMAQRLGQGIFFALPTMATANAMYERVDPVYARFFDGGRPSLVLAHSRRDLVLSLEETPLDAPYEALERLEPPTASLTCAAWLADSRKKALLAHVGVGTIDQALMAVLPLRHQSLRLWGLAGHVLLVDEVHACDAYVHQLLCELLRFHAAFGGSAILLSATLPAGQRTQLLAAFAQGAAYSNPTASSLEYPLLTHLSAEGSTETPVAARLDASRRIVVEPLRTRYAVEERLVEAAESGGCACYIRNTVRDAMEAYLSLRARLGEGRVTLFHSRFTVGDRARIEQDVLRRFGPRSSAADRRGQILVATQVVEQSLDLDFDYLVTDLAPIDLIIQRAGRLLRHRRDREGNRIEGPDQRGPAVLGLNGPEPEDDPKETWYRAAFAGAALVYPDHGRLWLAARWLEEKGGFSMPEDARTMIEHVYGPDSEAGIPAGFARNLRFAEGKERGEESLALLNALKLDVGYKATGMQWADDAYTPTRLGEPTVTLRLARRVGDRIQPWHDAGRNGWRLSEVQERKARVAAEDYAENALLSDLRQRMSDAGRYCLVVILSKSGEDWVGKGVDLGGLPVELRYSETFGLAVLQGGRLDCST